MAEDHHDRQHRGRHQVAGRPGGQQRERHQPVGDAMQAGAAQAAPGVRQHRHGHQCCGDGGDQVGQRTRVGHQEFPCHRQAEQPGRQHRQRQLRAQQPPFGACQQPRARPARSWRRRQNKPGAAGRGHRHHAAGLVQHGRHPFAPDLRQQSRPRRPARCGRPAPSTAATWALASPVCSAAVPLAAARIRSRSRSADCWACGRVGAGGCQHLLGQLAGFQHRIEARLGCHRQQRVHVGAGHFHAQIGACLRQRRQPLVHRAHQIAAHRLALRLPGAGRRRPRRARP